MQNLRIEEAIALQGARRRIKNEQQQRPAHYKVMTKANLGRLLFPNAKAPRVQMSNLLNRSTTINPDHLIKICGVTGVDPNFLFGFSSVHDKDYGNLVVVGEKQSE